MNQDRSGQLGRSTREDREVYSQPRLAVYGSVRNLTGGSGGSMGDGQLGMTRG